MSAGSISPGSAGSDGSPSSSAWQQKQQEIRELQAANKTLLQRVTSHSAGSSKRITRGSGGQSPAPSSPVLPWPASPLAAYLPPSSPGSAADDGGVTRSALNEEVQELKQALAEQRREARSQEDQAARASDALREAQRRNAQLLEAARQSREPVQYGGGEWQGEETSPGGERRQHKQVLSYIENDLTLAKEERQKAEALLRSQVWRWEETAERSEAECRLAESRHEAAKTEQRTASFEAKQATAQVEQAVEKRMAGTQFQAAAAEAALQELRMRLEQGVEERILESRAASEFSAQRDNIRAQLSDAERRLAQLEPLEMSIAAASEEAQRKQAEAAEERKKIKREAARRSAELQARCGEVEREAEESAAKAKEVERTLHNKIFSLRQDRQKVEAKLRSQVQVLQLEWQTERDHGSESQEIAERFGEILEELSDAKQNSAQEQVECAALRKQCSRAVRQLEDEIATAERGHAQQLSELREGSEREWTVAANQAREAQEELERQLRANVGDVVEQARTLEQRLEHRLEAESQAAADKAAESMALRGELDALSGQHQAVLQALRREHAAADGQFKDMVQQVEEKERRLGQLQDEVPSEDALPLLLDGAYPSSGKSGSATSLSRKAPTQTFISPRSDAGGGSARELNAADDASNTEEGLLRSLARQREARKAQRLCEDLDSLIARGPNPDEALQLLVQTAKACEGLAQIAAEEERRCLASRDREASLRSQLARTSSRASALQEEALRHASAQGQACVAEAELLQQRFQIELEVALGERDSEHARAKSEASHVAEHRSLHRSLREELDEVRDWARVELMEERERGQADAQQERERSARVHHELCELRQGNELTGAAWEEDPDTESIRTELHELRNEMQKQLSAGRTAQYDFSQRESRLERQLGNLREDYQEESEELRQALRQVAKSRTELDASRARERLQEQRHHQCEQLQAQALQSNHDEEREMLATEIGVFQNEKFVLEERLTTLAAQHEVLPRLESELDDARLELERVTSQLGQEDVARRRQAAQRLRTFEREEEAAMQERSGIQEMLLQEVQERERVLLQTKEQLRAAREQQARERQRMDKQAERMRMRIHAIEQTEEAMERQREQAERVERCGRRSHDDLTSEFGQARREGRKVMAALQEEQALYQSLEQGLEASQVRLRSTEGELGTTEARCVELAAGEQAAQLEHRVLEARLTSNQEAAESWGEELSRRLQESESRSVREMQLDREALQRQGLALTADAVEARAEASEARHATERLAWEAQQLLPLLRDEDARELADLHQQGGARAEAATSQSFQAAARQLAALAKENAELRRKCQHSRHWPPSPGGGGGPGGGQARTGVGANASAGLTPATESTSAAIAAGKVSLLQREVVKLREENRDLKFASEKQEEQLQAAADLISMEGDSPTAGSISPTAGSTGRLPGSLLGGAERHMLRTEVRQQLKQAKADQARAQEIAQELRQEVEQVKAALWEQKELREKDQDLAQQKAQASDRKVRLLEAKLRSRTEAERQLLLEKESIEQQLNAAAKQLEALLTEERSDGDLQRDLLSLSQRFEALHKKHTAQLAKASEQEQQLQKEQAARRDFEDQALSFKEQVSVLRQQEVARERDLQQARSEHAALVCEASQLRGMQHEQALASRDLEAEVRRLHDQLEQVRQRNPSAREAVSKIQQLEGELQLGRAARQHLQNQVEELRRTSEGLRTQVLALSAGTGAGKGDQLLAAWNGRSGASQAQQRLVGAVGESNDGPVVVRTVQDRLPDRSTPHQPQRGEAGQVSVDPGVLRTLQEIQVKLSSHEAELMEHKVASFSSSSSIPSGTGAGVAKAQLPPRAEDPPLLAGTAPAAAFNSAAAGPPAGGGQADLEGLEREFADFARSKGYEGDIGLLWAEARSQAAALNEHQAGAAATAERERPVAADVQLSGPATGYLAGTYPETPPIRGAVPHPGDDSADAEQEEEENAAGLPAAAREAFRRAEKLCEQQRPSEAVPLFQQVLHLVDDSPEAVVPNAAKAEVWAHLGVAMQSLDRVPEAVDSYRRAVALDPSLHVCFANLATLHAYLHEYDASREFICKALALDPANGTYNQIKTHLDETSATVAQQPARGDTVAAAEAPAQRGEGTAGEEKEDPTDVIADVPVATKPATAAHGEQPC